MALQARNEATQLNSKVLQGKDQGQPSSDLPYQILPARHRYTKAEELDRKLEIQMIDWCPCLMPPRWEAQLKVKLSLHERRGKSVLFIFILFHNVPIQSLRIPFVLIYFSVIAST